MKTIKTQIPVKHMAVFQEYSGDYGVDLNHLMESEAHGQLACMQDAAFAVLVDLDNRAEEEKGLDSVTVELSFCDQVYSLIELVAKLLRRDINDLVSDFLRLSAFTLSSYIEEGKKKPDDEWFHKQMLDWAKSAIEFHQCAKHNKTVEYGDEISTWEYLQLERTEDCQEDTANEQALVA